MCLFTVPLWSCGHASINDPNFYTAWPDPTSCALTSQLLASPETAVDTATFRAALIPINGKRGLPPSDSRAIALTTGQNEHCGGLDNPCSGQFNPNRLSPSLDALVGRLARPPGTWDSGCPKSAELVVGLEPVQSIECGNCFAGRFLAEGREDANRDHRGDFQQMSPEMQNSEMQLLTSGSGIHGEVSADVGFIGGHRQEGKERGIQTMGRGGFGFVGLLEPDGMDVEMLSIGYGGLGDHGGGYGGWRMRSPVSPVPQMVDLRLTQQPAVNYGEMFRRDCASAGAAASFNTNSPLRRPSHQRATSAPNNIAPRSNVLGDIPQRSGHEDLDVATDHGSRFHVTGSNNSHHDSNGSLQPVRSRTTEYDSPGEEMNQDMINMLLAELNQNGVHDDQTLHGEIGVSHEAPFDDQDICLEQDIDMLLDDDASQVSQHSLEQNNVCQSTRRNSKNDDPKSGKSKGGQSAPRRRKPRPSARLPSPVLHGTRKPERNRKDNLYLPEMVHTIRGTTALTSFHNPSGAAAAAPNADNPSTSASTTDISANKINAFIASHKAGTLTLKRDPITGRPIDLPPSTPAHSPPTVPTVFDSTFLPPPNPAPPRKTSQSTKPTLGSIGFCSPPLRRIFAKFHHSQHEFSLYSRAHHAAIIAAWKSTPGYRAYLESPKRKKITEEDPFQQFRELRREEGLDGHVGIMFDDAGSVFLFCKVCAMAFKFPFAKKWVATYRGHEDTQMHLKVLDDMKQGVRPRGIEQYMK